MASLAFEDLVQELSARDCRIVARAAAELTTAHVHVRSAQLERAHDCITDRTANGADVALARLFLSLQAPGERAGQAVRLLQELDDPAIRAEAFHTLVDLGQPAVGELAALADHPDPLLRRSAIQSLHDLGDVAPTDVLVRGLTDPDFSTRWAAGNALIDKGPTVVKPVLRAIALFEPSRSFHEAARRVLHHVPVAPQLAEDLRGLIANLGRYTTIYDSSALAFALLQRSAWEA